MQWKSTDPVKLPVRYTIFPPWGQTKRVGTNTPLPIPAMLFFLELGPEENICLKIE